MAEFRSDNGTNINKIANVLFVSSGVVFKFKAEYKLNFGSIVDKKSGIYQKS